MSEPIEWEGGIRATPVRQWESRRTIIHAQRNMRAVCGTTAGTYVSTTVAADVTCADCLQRLAAEQEQVTMVDYPPVAGKGTVFWHVTNAEYSDQQADLPGGLWAQVGPESDGRWSWVVFDFDQDNAEVASGFAATEAAAKAAAESEG